MMKLVGNMVNVKGYNREIVIPKGYVIQDNTPNKKEAQKYLKKWKSIMGDAILVKRGKTYYIYSLGVKYG
jgi:hypothetical protein